MGRISLRRDVRLFILIYCVSRVFLLFIPYSPADFLDISLTLETAINGSTFAYPILFRFQMLAFQLLFGRNLFGERLGFIIYEIGLLLILYRFAITFIQQEYQKTLDDSASSALKIVYIYSFFPQILYIYSGSGEIYASFFMILGLYMYYRERIVLSSIFLSIGFLLEIYPIFCMIPILIRYLSKHQFKEIGTLIIAMMVTILLISIPFYLLNSNFFTDFLIQFSRIPKAVSGWNVLYGMLPIWDLINIGFIRISPIGITFFIWVIIYMVCSFKYYNKHENVSKPEEFALISTFILLLSVVFLSLHPRYIIFCFGIFCLLLESRISLEVFQKQSMVIISILLGTAISTLSLWPQLNFTTIEQPDFTIENMVLYAALLFVLYSSISLLWINYGEQIRICSSRIEKINVIQLFPVVFLLLLLQAVFDELPIVPIIPNLIGVVVVFWSAKKIAKHFLPKSKTLKLLV